MDNREVQLFKLHVLSDVVSFCEKNGIRYFLYAGTLLGAIRHKGFIPWDDDIDLAMLWDDYKKFLQLATKGLGEPYFVQNYITDKEYFCLWTQLRVNNTTSMPARDKAVNIHYGICLDIFPLISMENDEKEYSRQIKAFKLAHSLLATDYMKAKKEKARGIQRIINMTPRKIRHRIVSDIFKKYARIDETKEWLGGIDSAVLKRKYKYKDFSATKKYNFEGMDFDGPINGESVLVCNYGDNWMSPPPIEERKGHELVLGELINDIDHDYSYYR